VKDSHQAQQVAGLLETSGREVFKYSKLAVLDVPTAFYGDFISGEKFGVE
jgi:hypothetical protein